MFKITIYIVLGLSPVDYTVDQICKCLRVVHASQLTDGPMET